MTAAAAPGSRCLRERWSAVACPPRRPRTTCRYPRRAGSWTALRAPDACARAGAFAAPMYFIKLAAIVGHSAVPRRMHDRVRRRGCSPPILIARDGLRLLRRAGRLAGARRGRPRDRAHPARREREPRGALSDGAPRRADRRRGEGARGALLQLLARRGRLRNEHDDDQLRAHARARPRAEEGDEIIVTRLDHDGNVAPWVELADDLGLVMHHVDINADTTLDLADLESKLSRAHAGRLVPVGIERDRHARRREARGRARTPRRRDRVGRRRPLRRARADGRAGDRRRRRALLALQVLRPAPRHGVRPRVARQDLAPVQGAAVRERRPTARRFETGHAPLRAARRPDRDVRLPRRHRRHGGDPRRTSARSASASSTA